MKELIVAAAACIAALAALWWMAVYTILDLADMLVIMAAVYLFVVYKLEMYIKRRRKKRDIQRKV